MVNPNLNQISMEVKLKQWAMKVLLQVLIFKMKVMGGVICG